MATPQATPMARLLAFLHGIHPGWLIFLLINLNFQGWHVDPNGERYLSYARYQGDPLMVSCELLV
jgi:hypothetical protein